MAPRGYCFKLLGEFSTLSIFDRPLLTSFMRWAKVTTSRNRPVARRSFKNRRSDSQPRPSFPYSSETAGTGQLPLHSGSGVRGHGLGVRGSGAARWKGLLDALEQTRKRLLEALEQTQNAATRRPRADPEFGCPIERATRLKGILD